MKLVIYNIAKISLIVLLFALALSHQAKGADDNFDLLWQAKTYVPHWYQGKALAGIESEVKIVAVNRSPYASQNLDFDWFLNFEKDFRASGVGKNYFITTLRRYENTTITVKICDAEKKLITEKGIILSANDGSAKILFYKQHPLLGALFNQALKDNLRLTEENIAIKAEPYFFSYKGAAPLLNYSWKMNNANLAEAGNRNTINLKIPGLEIGSSVIGVKITNPENIYQALGKEKEIRINYGANF
ncbi:MAG: hypothetical protein COT67_01920 [Candidatus Tagabacteria bacterium CG09_land_8_20_14_0_10_41_14]|uniref:Uncharacterized protein n=2 Tax=Candidatus Tagaibacteriota TaxID=1817918 RepID=A0A2H0WL58_9BACT|nr:MAG: hypothetical protein COT67_01920 [Candidatus Tagabacteria bacterium CG09_land_8_20_14_0_10_41_14]PJE73105.1 MAG: hypothetical protein COV00_01630 [Candidatus Tagabacteria bacterium CG10_big_fil_rev_8_21_14_0_10_40_13]